MGPGRTISGFLRKENDGKQAFKNLARFAVKNGSFCCFNISSRIALKSQILKHSLQLVD